MTHFEVFVLKGLCRFDLSMKILFFLDCRDKYGVNALMFSDTGVCQYSYLSVFLSLGCEMADKYTNHAPLNAKNHSLETANTF